MSVGIMWIAVALLVVNAVTAFQALPPALFSSHHQAVSHDRTHTGPLFGVVSRTQETAMKMIFDTSSSSSSSSQPRMIMGCPPAPAASAAVRWKRPGWILRSTAGATTQESDASSSPSVASQARATNEVSSKDYQVQRMASFLWMRTAMVVLRMAYQRHQQLQQPSPPEVAEPKKAVDLSPQSASSIAGVVKDVTSSAQNDKTTTKSTTEESTVLPKVSTDVVVSKKKEISAEALASLESDILSVAKQLDQQLQSSSSSSSNTPVDETKAAAETTTLVPALIRSDVEKNEGGVLADLSSSNTTLAVKEAETSSMQPVDVEASESSENVNATAQPDVANAVENEKDNEDIAEGNVEDDDDEEDEEEDTEDEGEQEHPSMLHRKEGDRVIALKDEFSTGDGVNIPPAISLNFGRPLEVVEAGLPPLRSSESSTEVPTPIDEKVGRTTSSSLGATAAMNVVVLDEGVAVDKKEPVGVNESSSSPMAPATETPFVEPAFVPTVLPSLESSTKLEMVDSPSEDSSKETETAEPQKMESSVEDRTASSQSSSLPELSEVKMVESPGDDDTVSEKQNESSAASETQKDEETTTEAGSLSAVEEDETKDTIALALEEIVPVAESGGKDDATPVSDKVAKETGGAKTTTAAAKEPTLEDQAFALLVELGMVQINPDPRSPDYDHSKDDEFCRENIWLGLQ